MKIYHTTNDYARMPLDIKAHILDLLDGAQGSFDALLGGDIYELESVAELSEIVVDPASGRTAVDTVTPMDNCQRIANYTSFFMATNDAGGNVYFVPNWIVDNSIILQSIVSATVGWQEWMKNENN